MAYLEETVGDLEHHLSKKTPMQHLPVVRWLVPAWPMGGKFLLECKKGILNFVIMRPICTVLGFFTDIFDLYGQGQIDFAKSYVYLAAITNFSQVGEGVIGGSWVEKDTFNALDYLHTIPSVALFEER